MKLTQEFFCPECGMWISDSELVHYHKIDLSDPDPKFVDFYRLIDERGNIVVQGEEEEVDEWRRRNVLPLPGAVGRG